MVFPHNLNPFEKKIKRTEGERLSFQPGKKAQVTSSGVKQASLCSPPRGSLLEACLSKEAALLFLNLLSVKQVSALPPHPASSGKQLYFDWLIFFLFFFFPPLKSVPLFPNVKCKLQSKCPSNQCQTRQEHSQSPGLSSPQFGFQQASPEIVQAAPTSRHLATRRLLNLLKTIKK